MLLSILSTNVAEIDTTQKAKTPAIVYPTIRALASCSPAEGTPSADQKL